MRIRVFVSFLAALCCQAQQVSGPKTDLVQAPAGALKIIVVQGEEALNNIRTRSAAPLIVEVRDDADKPIPGAEVVFQLPPAGPGGVFNGWMRTQTARTGPEGRAESNGFTPNDEVGRFNIKVTATAGTKSASTIIAQINTVSGRSESGKQVKSKNTLLKVLLLVGAAGAAGGIIAATRGGSSSTPATPPTPITVTAGPITIGGPR